MSTSQTILHLTEDQLDDLLLGEPVSADAQAHLAACELCRAQLAPFQSSVAAFNQATQAWSEAKSNTLNRDLSGLAPTPSHTGWILAGSSVAAAVVVGVALSHSAGLSSRPAPLTAAVAPVATPAHTAVQPAATDREREIAEDNAMLGAIDSAIRPTAPPTSLYEETNLRPQRGHRRREEMD
jgi:hypothetical protein